MLKVLSDGRSKPWQGWPYAVGVVFVLWLATVLTYWIVK